MSKSTTPGRACCWHNRDGSPCETMTTRVDDRYGGIPVCMAHSLDLHLEMTRALDNLTEELYADVEGMRYEIADEALREHLEEEGCDVLAFKAADEATATPTRENFVYYMRCGDYVKIGRSTTPVQRLRAIQNLGGVRAPSGLDLSQTRLERVEKRPVEFERKRHDEFAHLRAEGEWFRSAPALERFMLGLDAPDAHFGANV